MRFQFRCEPNLPALSLSLAGKNAMSDQVSAEKLDFVRIDEALGERVIAVLKASKPRVGGRA
jgi:hypothetical protein